MQDKDELLEFLMRDDVYARLVLGAAEVAEIVPEVLPMVGLDHRNPHHQYDIWVHTAHCVAFAPKDPLVRLTLLLHDIGKPVTYRVGPDGVAHFRKHEEIGAEIAAPRFRALGFEEETVMLLSDLIRIHDKDILPGELRTWITRLGTGGVLMLLDIKEADARAHGEAYRTVRAEQARELRRLINEQAADS
ncbi:MAG: HD domain-containing protein [Clostridiales Family XIII bacterium]|jgi:tRNA nucleotidyltransferase (CCA-adding enzyme)|nr:HD domain-containing protein [Clostridiales Family XIII bacterium]